MNIGFSLWRNARELPDKTAVVVNEGNRYITYRQLNERANRLANALIELGVQKGDKIAYLLYNSLEIVDLTFATAKIGALLVPLNFRFQPRELRYVIENSDSSLVFYCQEFEEVIEELSSGVDTIREWISVEEKGKRSQLDYEELVSKGSPKEPVVPLQEDDELNIMYTSGTTGFPKGVVHTHRSRIWNSLNMIVDTQLGKEDIFAIVTPMFHIAAGNTMLLSNMFLGATTIIFKSFSTTELLRAIGIHGITSLFAVPTMFALLLEDPEINSADLSSLRNLFTGGSVIPVELLDRLTSALPNVKIFDLMGLTEAGPLTTFLHPADMVRKRGSVGRAHFSQSVRVVDQNGNDVLPGEVGEIKVRGPAVMKEYYNNPEATAQAFKDGWLYTGDLAKVDEEGYQYLVVRRTDLIVSGGENIYPAEVEAVLLEHPDIKEVAVIGVNDPIWGQSVRAVVVPNQRASLNEGKIISFCKKRLAGYKKPKSVVFTDGLPRNQMGKVLYKQLRDRYGYDPL